MNIRIESKNGFSIETGINSDLKLLEYPDFGLPTAIIQSYKIPGRDGELFDSSNIGPRDITIKAELNIPVYILSKVLVPGEAVKVVIENKWSIEGHIYGISNKHRPARLVNPVITIIIRCLNPFFSKINSKRTVNFDNSGGGIFQGGNYTYQEIKVLNEGDVPCPVNISMKCNSTTSTAGLFTSVDWNNGDPIFSGIIFKKGTSPDQNYFITTDTFSDRFFESRTVMDNTLYFLLPPGETRLYAQNVTGEITITPKYLYIDGRDV